jgi:hypothetical protein
MASSPFDGKSIRDLLANARKQFFVDDNVMGVGIAMRRRRGEIIDGELVLAVYVAEKRDGADGIPRTFEGVPTDVVPAFEQPTKPPPPGSLLARQLHADAMSLDSTRVHEWLKKYRRRTAAS